jgi:hypothetical protein
MKSTHVQTHARNPVTIVGAIEKHRTSQHSDRVWRNQRRTHGDDESAGAAAVGDGESAEFFLVPYCLFVARSDKKIWLAKKMPTETSSPLFFMNQNKSGSWAHQSWLNRASRSSWPKATERAESKKPSEST